MAITVYSITYTTWLQYSMWTPWASIYYRLRSSGKILEADCRDIQLQDHKSWHSNSYRRSWMGLRSRLCENTKTRKIISWCTSQCMVKQERSLLKWSNILLFTVALRVCITGTKRHKPQKTARNQQYTKVCRPL